MKKQTTAVALLAIASANPEGFTVSAENLTPITAGYAVAVADTQNNFGDEGLQRVINFVENHAEVNAFGGWLDSESGLFYLDATIVCDSLDMAIRLARANKQIALFDLNTLTEIRL